MVSVPRAEKKKIITKIIQIFYTLAARYPRVIPTSYKQIDFFANDFIANFNIYNRTYTYAVDTHAPTHTVGACVQHNKLRSGRVLPQKKVPLADIVQLLSAIRCLCTEKCINTRNGCTGTLKNFLLTIYAKHEMWYNYIDKKKNKKIFDCIERRSKFRWMKCICEYLVMVKFMNLLEIKLQCIINM